MPSGADRPSDALDALPRFAGRHVVIERGRVVWTEATPEIPAAPELGERVLHA